MKKIFFILLCVFQINSAIWDKEEFPKGHEALAIAKNWWEEMPNWEDKFPLTDQSATIHHEKDGIWIEYNSDLVTSFHEEKRMQNQPYQKKCAEIYLTNWQNKVLDFPLRLKAHSSRNDFVIELIRSGLYKGTFEEREIFFKSCRWEGDHTVVNISITCTDFDGKKITKECRSIRHDSRGISLYDKQDNKVSDNCESFGLFCREGRKISLHLNQSYYEFMMRLIETNHVGFVHYPPYTIQGRVKTDQRGKDIHYFECYYYGPLKESSSPLYPGILKERKRRQEWLRVEQEKLRMKQEIMFMGQEDMRIKQRNEERIKKEEEKKARIKARNLRVNFADDTNDTIEIVTPNSATNDVQIINPKLAAGGGKGKKSHWWNFSLSAMIFTPKVYTS